MKVPNNFHLRDEIKEFTVFSAFEVEKKRNILKFITQNVNDAEEKLQSSQNVSSCQTGQQSVAFVSQLRCSFNSKYGQDVEKYR